MKRVLSFLLLLGLGVALAANGFDQGVDAHKKHDFSKIASDYDTACKNNDFKACSELGFIYFAGFGMPKDSDKAFVLLQKACEGGNMVGCRGLARMYDLGEGVKKDGKKAIELYSKACNAGDTVGCMNLGIIYEYGENVQQDTSKAKEYYSKACHDGDKQGCELLVELTNKK